MRQLTLIISYIFFLVILLEWREKTTFDPERDVKRLRFPVFSVYPNYCRENRPGTKNVLFKITPNQFATSCLCPHLPGGILFSSKGPWKPLAQVSCVFSAPPPNLSLAFSSPCSLTADRLWRFLPSSALPLPMELCCLSDAHPRPKATEANPVCPVTREPAAADVPLMAQGDDKQEMLWSLTCLFQPPSP